MLLEIVDESVIALEEQIQQVLPEGITTHAAFLSVIKLMQISWKQVATKDTCALIW